MRAPWTILLLIALAATCAAQEAAPPIESLESRIWDLRLDASYAEAAEVAGELLELRRGNPQSAAYRIADAERLVETLRHAAALPAREQRELAAADSLEYVWPRLNDERKYAEAAAVSERQLEIRRRLLGQSHPDVASSLVCLALALESQGHLAEAELLYRDALELRRAALGEDHPDVALTMYWLAGLLAWRDEYDQSESLYRQVLATYRRVYGPDHAEIAVTLNNLAHLLSGKGDYEQAERLYREAVEMRRKVLGPEHEYVALSLGNLAYVLTHRGDYAAAEPIVREALAIARRRLGGEDETVAAKLAVLGILLYDQGDLVGAEPLYREALAIARKVPGYEPPKVAHYAANLALLLAAKGDYEGAEPLHREALAVYREFFGAEHVSVASALRNIGDVLWKKGNFEESEVYVGDALAMFRRIYGDDSPQVVTCLRYQGRARQSKGDYEGARSLYGEALAICRRQLGEGHSRVANIIHSLSQVAWADGDPEGAESLLVRAAEAHDAARLRAGSGLARSMFAEPPYAELAAVRLSLGNPEGAWPAVEKSLSLALADLLREAEERRLSPAESAREDSLRGALSDVERELEAFTEAARTDSSGEVEAKAEATRDRLFAVEAEWSAFQRALAAKHPVTGGEAFDLEHVQSVLPEGTAIIGWLDVEVVGEQHSWCYAIRDSGPVAWARAGSGGASEGSASPSRLSRSFRCHLADPATARAGIRRESYELWSDRIEPLAAALEGVTEIVVLPSGAMLGVPIEALIDGAGVCVGERYAVSYAPSATINTWLAERGGGEVGERMLLVGDPPFNEGQLAAMESGAEVLLASLPQELMPPDLVRSALAGNDDLLSSLPRLGGTRAEVRAIEELSGDVSVLLGPDASEQELVWLAEAGALAGYGTIHIATHALVDDERPERSALVLSQVGLPDALESAMAGTRIYDGLLSAKEIVREWDLDADLVTLSACETGLGKEVGGEGYVGFAHAFFQAGARSLLVSLWKVDDRATALLMRRFYENRFGRNVDERSGRVGEPMPKAEALREAKRFLREYEDASGNRPYDHPFFWSAFILMGDAS